MVNRHEANRAASATRNASITTRIRVQGMDCAGSAIKIKDALRRLPGVEEVDVSVPAGAATVTHDQSNAPMTNG